MRGDRGARRPGRRQDARGDRGRPGRASGATLTGDSQLRWLGPGEGRRSTWRPPRSSTRSGTCGPRPTGKPLWQLLADMTPGGARRAASTSATSPTRSPRTRRSTSCDATPSRQGRARRRMLERDGYPGLHHLGRLARLLRRQAAPAAAARRVADGLDARQDEGRRATSRTTSAGCAIIREEIGPRPHADDRRQPGLGRRRRRSTG